jgi:t-SNARE complex subunit (syntaxin)
LYIQRKATKLQAAENDLKQLMADVTRAMQKAQEAVARITSNALAATAETGSTTSSPSSAHS